MRVLIEQISTGLFYKTDTCWVHSKGDGRAFATSREAIEFCLGKTMPDVRLLVAFNDPAHDFYLSPFGPSELAAKTRELLKRNSELQRQQWTLAGQVTAATAELVETRRKRRSSRARNQGLRRENMAQSAA